MRKAVGTQGSWFARLGDEMLPCIHRHWIVDGMGYHDPFKRHAGKDNEDRIQQYSDAIMAAGRVILTDDIATWDADGDVAGFRRSRYIAVFEVDGVTYSKEDGIRFRMTRRIEELKP